MKEIDPKPNCPECNSNKHMQFHGEDRHVIRKDGTGVEVDFLYRCGKCRNKWTMVYLYTNEEYVLDVASDAIQRLEGV